MKDKVLEFAKTQKLNADKISTCFAEPGTADYVNKTVAEGRQPVDTADADAVCKWPDVSGRTFG